MPRDQEPAEPTPNSPAPPENLPFASNLNVSSQPVPKRIGKIFISYSRDDKVAVESLITKLNSFGYNIWYDEYLEVGALETFEQQLERQLHEADGVLLMLSFDSANSAYVKKEIDFARAQRKMIFPLLVKRLKEDGRDLQLEKDLLAPLSILSKQVINPVFREDQLFSDLLKDLPPPKNILRFIRYLLKRSNQSLLLIAATLLIAVPLLAGLFFGVVIPIINPKPTPTPTLPTITLSPLSWESGVQPTVFALANDEDKLYIAAQDGQNVALYTHSASATSGKPELMLDAKTVPQFDYSKETYAGRVTRMMVDCKHNLWVLLDGHGVVLVKGTDTKVTLSFDKSTFPVLAAKFNTPNDIATHCKDNKVETWLAMEQVHTVQYSGEFPDLTDIEVLPPQNDQAFNAMKSMEAAVAPLQTKVITSIPSFVWTNTYALLYSETQKRLYLSSSAGVVGYISTQDFGTWKVKILSPLSNVFAFVETNDHRIFAGGGKYVWELIGTDDTPLQANLLSNTGVASKASPEFDIFTLASGKNNSLFIGGKSGLPFAIYEANQFSYPSLTNRSATNDILMTKTLVWLAMDMGLFWFERSPSI